MMMIIIMFSRKDFFRLFDGLLRISTRKTNAEPRCLTSLGGQMERLIWAPSETPRIGPRTSSGEPFYGFGEPSINQTCMLCPY